MKSSTEKHEMTEFYSPRSNESWEGSSSQPMRVSDATRIFCNFGDDFRDDVESLVSLIRSCDLKVALHNSNYLHALQLTQLMFDHTDHSFCMLTGDAADGFLKCLQSSFRKMLERIAIRGGKARMIVLSEGQASDSTLKEHRLRFEGVFDYLTVRKPSTVKLRHFIVCDNEMVRDEELHEPLNQESSANEVKAKVHFKNENVAKVFTMKFDSLWKGITAAKHQESLRR